MEQLHFITKLLDIKDPNIQIMDVINKDTNKEIIAKLDYDAPSCPECGSQMKKYDFQKPSKIPYLETNGISLEFSLKNAVLSAISAQKWLSLRLPSSRKITNPSSHQPKDCSEAN